MKALLSVVGIALAMTMFTVSCGDEQDDSVSAAAVDEGGYASEDAMCKYPATQCYLNFLTCRNNCGANAKCIASCQTMYNSCCACLGLPVGCGHP